MGMSHSSSSRVCTLRSPRDPRRGTVVGSSAWTSPVSGSSCLSSRFLALSSDTSPLPTKATVQHSGWGLVRAILLLLQRGYTLSDPSAGQSGLAHPLTVALPVDPDRLHDARSPWCVRTGRDNGRQHDEATGDA